LLKLKASSCSLRRLGQCKADGSVDAFWSDLPIDIGHAESLLSFHSQSKHFDIMFGLFDVSLYCATL